jgi:hypothetical protein
MAAAREPVLPPAWGDVLDQVQQSLALALGHADQRLQALAAPTEPAPAPATFPADHQARCDAVRRQLDGSVEEATRRVEEADATLAAAEEALRTWLDASAAAQRTLADRAARAIG